MADSVSPYLPSPPPGPADPGYQEPAAAKPPAFLPQGMAPELQFLTQSGPFVNTPGPAMPPPPGFNPSPNLGTGDPGYRPDPYYDQLATAVNKMIATRHVTTSTGEGDYTVYTGQHLRDYLQGKLHPDHANYLDALLKMGAVNAAVIADPNLPLTDAILDSRNVALPLKRRANLPGTWHSETPHAIDAMYFPLSYDHADPSKTLQAPPGWEYRVLGATKPMGAEGYFHELGHAADQVMDYGRTPVLVQDYSSYASNPRTDINQIARKLNRYNLTDSPAEVNAITMENAYAQQHPNPSDMSNQHSRYLAAQPGDTVYTAWGGDAARTPHAPAGLGAITTMADYIQSYIKDLAATGYTIPSPPMAGSWR